MKLTFKGKSAIVSGASGGMGIECVKKLNDAGLKVLMLDQTFRSYRARALQNLSFHRHTG